MGTLVLTVASMSRGDEKKWKRVDRQSHAWERLCRRKPLYPVFLKACKKAEGTIPTLEEFNHQWPPEKDHLVYVQEAS